MAVGAGLGPVPIVAAELAPSSMIPVPARENPVHGSCRALVGRVLRCIPVQPRMLLLLVACFAVRTSALYVVCVPSGLCVGAGSRTRFFLAMRVRCARAGVQATAGS